MKTAEEWRNSFPDDDRDFQNCCVSLADIRKIQADALRYATNLFGDNKNSFLIALADQLDPQPTRPKP